jgi:hypothetical protein
VNRSARAGLTVGIALLLLGTTVYLVDRPPDGFIPNAFSLFGRQEVVFGTLGGNLPSFVHVLAFSLFTAAIIGGSRRTATAICLSWFVLEGGFELGQHASAAPLIAGLVPGWFEVTPILARTPDYFLYGTFDVWDLCASALGALSAYVFIRYTHRRAGAA